MSRTTIEIEDELKEELREARLPHESNYSDTIARLLDSHDVPFVTKDEAREIANEQITERVAPKAQR